MSRKTFHQDALDKLHERLGTIKADVDAAQQGAYEHLSQASLATEDEEPTDGS
jgi:hypothetical protein